MRYFLYNIFLPFKEKRAYFVWLLIFTLIAFVVGVYAGINLNNQVFSIDMSSISYINFLKGECGLLSLVFKLFLSLTIFYTLILVCHCKKYLIPLAIIIYMYFVYTQAVVLISLIVIYGFFNSIVLFFVLLIYEIFVIATFLISMMHMYCLIGNFDFFKSCFSWQNYILWFLLFLLIWCLIFSTMLLILKSFVILLVY